MSSDLNPLEHVLWECLKSTVYEIPVESEMESIVILKKPEIFGRVRQNFVCRCHSCLEVGGRPFEQLL